MPTDPTRPIGSGTPGPPATLPGFQEAWDAMSAADRATAESRRAWFSNNPQYGQRMQGGMAQFEAWAGYQASLPPPPPPPPVDAGGNAIFQGLATWLQGIGLGELFSVDGTGQPSGWLWDQIQAGIDTEAELQVAVESTDQWRTRFDAIVQQRAAAGRGEPVRVMSVAEVVAYEQTAAQLMRQAGMPSWLYDSYQDFTGLMVRQVSVGELQARIDRSLGLVASADPAVREAFAEFYGPSGDEALAAFFLNPDKTLSQVDTAARAAYTAGTARNVGLEVDQARAERVARSPLSEAAVFQSLNETAQLSSLTQGSFADAVDLTDDDLIDATFFGDAQARRELQRRIGVSQAANRASVGGANLSQRGTAVGSA